MHGASRRTAPAASSAGNTSDPEEPSTTQFNLAPMRTSLFTRPRTHPLPLSSRLWLIITTYLPLGFISFGGPGVHVVLLRQRFVDELKWIDLRTFLDLFALGNALPGPGSTQIAFAIATVTHGVLPGLIAFLFWSLPGAVGMTLLGAGVGQIPAQLHPAVLATLSGLNAAAVGLIALSAEQLAKASATDKITLAIVWLSASAGICYHAPWMYPTLIVAGGSATLVWDFRRTWGRPIMRMWKALSGAGKDRQGRADEGVEGDGVEMHRQDSGIGHQASTSPVAAAAVAAERIEADGGGGERDGNAIPLETPASNYTAGTFASTAPLRDSTPSRTTSRGEVSPPRTDNSTAQPAETDDTDTAAPSDPLRVVPFGVSYALIGAFVLVLAVPLAIRGGLSSAGKAVPRALSLFVNFTLAGTLIFGGGPVVVPMLRDYVVAPGWVSNRDFLLIFAILQAFPGPNFNFSLALGFLALSSLPSPSLSQSIGGSLLGYIGIFLPGLLLMLAFLPIYSIFRLHPIARATIRGLNAAATGLVWVAVWQLFLVGHIYVGATGTTGGTEGETRALSGPLTADPWWAVVASGSFLACRNYGLPPWAGVLGGGAAGALWYAATRS